MIIVQPTTAVIDKNNSLTTRLYFEGGAVKPFYMRGAIAWPEGRDEGFALMAGYDLRDKAVIIFDEFGFWTTTHLLNDDHTLRKREKGDGYYLGLIEFIEKNLARYKTCSYFHGGQNKILLTKWANELYRISQAPKRLELIEVPDVEQIGNGLVLEKIKTHAFKGASGSQLESGLVQFLNMQQTTPNGDAGVDGRMRALRVLLAGFDWCPWMDLGTTKAFIDPLQLKENGYGFNTI